MPEKAIVSLQIWSQNLITSGHHESFGTTCRTCNAQNKLNNGIPIPQALSQEPGRESHYMEWLPGLVMHLGTEDSKGQGTCTEKDQRVPEVNHVDDGRLSTAKETKDVSLIISINLINTHSHCQLIVVCITFLRIFILALKTFLIVTCIVLSFTHLRLFSNWTHTKKMSLEKETSVNLHTTWSILAHNSLNRTK